MKQASWISKITDVKRFRLKISLITLALLLGTGATLFSCRPDLWESLRTAATGAFSLDRTAAAAAYPVVTTDRLNIRSGRGTSYDVISTVSKGTPLELLSKPAGDKQWVRVKTPDGKSGWCLAEYLKRAGSADSLPPKAANPAVSSSAPASSASSAGNESRKQDAQAAVPISLETAARPLSVQVSIADQKVTVLDAKSRMVKQFLCSTGAKGSETPSGTFIVSDRGKSFYNPSIREGGYYWTRFYGAYLFHSVPFDGSYKLEPEEAAKLGTPASHGCVRLSIEDAKWIYDHIQQGTKVVVR